MGLRLVRPLLRLGPPQGHTVIMAHPLASSSLRLLLIPRTMHALHIHPSQYLSFVSGLYRHVCFDSFPKTWPHRFVLVRSSRSILPPIHCTFGNQHAAAALSSCSFLSMYFAVCGHRRRRHLSFHFCVDRKCQYFLQHFSRPGTVAVHLPRGASQAVRIAASSRAGCLLSAGALSWTYGFVAGSYDRAGVVEH